MNHEALTPSRRLAQIEQARHSVLEAQAGTPCPWLAASIDRSWRRCLNMGLDPSSRVVFEPVSEPARRRSLDEGATLRQAATPVIRSMARAMLHTRYFALLTDAQGIVLDVQGPVDRLQPAAAAMARVGVNLSEPAVGTTAIGAVLAEGQTLWLHRGEHFFRDNGVFSCVGAPIWGPLGGCVGMLDLTGVDVPEQPALRHLVSQAARNIENALVLGQPHRLMLRLNWPGRVLGNESDGLLGLDADGHITGLNRPAAELLGLLPGERPGHVGTYLMQPLADLFDAARHGRGSMEVPLGSGLRLQVLAQDAHGPSELASACHPVPLKDMETALIRKAVQDARGNVMEAARALGISRATVYRKLGRRD